MREIGMPEDALPMLEMSCPEYFVTDIGRVEPAGRDNVRFYCCARKGDALEPLYQVIIPIEDLVNMARFCLQVAAEHHNNLMMMVTPPPRIAH